MGTETPRCATPKGAPLDGKSCLRTRNYCIWPRNYCKLLRLTTATIAQLLPTKNNQNELLHPRQQLLHNYCETIAATIAALLQRLMQQPCCVADMLMAMSTWRAGGAIGALLRNPHDVQPQRASTLRTIASADKELLHLAQELLQTIATNHSNYCTTIADKKQPKRTIAPPAATIAQLLRNYCSNYCTAF